jgi:phage terminase large subunit-like protein
MVLEEFQQRMLRAYFGGSRETLIVIPKKNGKSTLVAALALYHLMVTPDADCVIAAASRDQAEETIMKQIVGFIRRSKSLSRVLVVKRRRIETRFDSGTVRVLAADADTADGWLGTLAIVDEMHRQRSAEMYGVFRDGLGARAGQMITISTAGEDEESALGKMRAAAFKLPGVKRDAKKAYTYAESPSGDYVMHEWALTLKDDREDLDVVARANPAPWQTVEELRRRRESPSMTGWQWARFACGVWMRGEDAAISPLDWAKCGGGEDIPHGEAVTLGLDLGWKWDTTAIVPVFAAGEDDYRIGVPTVVVPPRDGTSTDEDVIVEAIVSMQERWHVLGLVFDPAASGEMLAQRLEKSYGMNVISHSQKPEPMADAAARLSELVRSGSLKHPDDPTLTSHVLSAVAKRTTGEKWRLVKDRKPIDACIALAMALAVAGAPKPEPMVAFV